MRVRTTSTSRTYRYVRVGIVGAVLLLIVGVVTGAIIAGPVTSLSAAYYTPARDLFVGAIFAVAAALIALSGRSLEQALLDNAAILAVVIAVVPTPVGPGDAPGSAAVCPTAATCVPEEYVPTVATGVISLVIVGVLGLVAALALARVQATMTHGFRVALGAAATLVIGTGLWFALAPAGFLAYAHVTATVAFFALIAAVAAIDAVAPTRGRRGGGIRGLYLVVAGGIVVTIAVLVVVLTLRLAGIDLAADWGVPIVLWGEILALVLFGVFWVTQTVELWHDPDPRFRS
ncbi:hypothetical protein M4I32_03600 [Microbacterium sp. LRZ72]|uniref:hypothetical protein n=1 Tax=Microbacterium sp. LRZ72 TaxID=2942481 RepID=UPI0029BBDB48|nr:hypothetical protein [Microbacterium sp. LRZ72]MDX2375881.1 hypothetical protein [Microbacterium sp. LRZ72]